MDETFLRGSGDLVDIFVDNLHQCSKRRDGLYIPGEIIYPAASVIR